MPADDTAATCVVAVHGAKARRLEDVLARGLERPSSAWFVISPRTARRQLAATLAATVHLALGVDTCRTLADLRHAGAYTSWFSANPELLPVVVCFPDCLAHNEKADRYLWLGPPSAVVTNPYCKVERVGRGVFPDSRTARFRTVSLTEFDRVEQRLDRAGCPAGGARLITKIGSAANPAGSAAVGEGTKLGWLCAGLAMPLVEMVVGSLQGLGVADSPRG